MQVMNGIVGRRSWLLALATLSALLAVAALTLAPARAAPPEDLALSLSLVDDSDNVVPDGAELQVKATLSYTAEADAALQVTGGKLRVSGDHEWEHNGRSSLNVESLDFGGEAYAQTGWAVAVDADASASGGDIVVAGAPNDAVNAQSGAGSADLFVDGMFVKRLTAGENAQADARFGQSVDAAGGVIVVGAPFEGGDGTSANGPQGAVYLFDVQGEQIAKLTPGMDSGDTNTPITHFGFTVAIADNGRTIVAAAKSSKAQSDTATAFLFTRPGTGWADVSTDDSTVLYLSSDHSDHTGANPAGLAISGNGNVIVQTFEGANKSAIALYEKPSGAWADVSTVTVTLDTPDNVNGVRIGDSLAITMPGSTIVASGASPSATAGGNGAAYMWIRGAPSWSSKATHAMKMTNADGAEGDLFGHRVGVQFEGEHIYVSNAWKQADNYAAGEVHVFVRKGPDWPVSDDTAELVLTTPPEQEGSQLFFGLGLAGDKETLVVGQTESIDFIDEPIETGHGRVITFDVTQADPNPTQVQPTAAPLVAPVEMTSICDSMPGDDDLMAYTCTLSTEGGTAEDGAAIIIPTGTPDGAFTISGSVTVDGGEAGTDDDETYSASLVVEIGTVTEVDSVTFDIAVDDAGADYPSTIPAIDPTPDMPNNPGKTVLQLSVLNENGTASAKGTIASVLFTTTSGTLSLVSPGGGCGGTEGSNGLACQVDIDGQMVDNDVVNALDSTNSGAIQVSLTHPGSGQSGTAAVSARVLSVAGDTFAPDPIEITFSGSAETLAISEPATSLLNVEATDEGDNRDVMTLSVSAEDKSGNSVDVPDTSRSAKLKDPDGKTVTSGVVVAFPKTETVTVTVQDENGDDVEEEQQQDVLDAAGNLQVEIIVDAEAADALATGAYTLEVRAGGKTAAQTINVSAGAAAVALSADGAAEIAQRLSVTAEVTDADGGAVADGTPITFVEGEAQATPVLVQVRADAKTSGGAASAVYLVVGPGTGFVTVSSGDSASDVLLIQTTEPTAEPVPPAESLSRTVPNNFATYLGAEAATASELLAGLEGVSGLLRWDGSAWQRYIVADGREVPGSVDFEITRGAILWLSG